MLEGGRGDWEELWLGFGGEVAPWLLYNIGSLCGTPIGTFWHPIDWLLTWASLLESFGPLLAHLGLAFWRPMGLNLGSALWPLIDSLFGRGHLASLLAHYLGSGPGTFGFPLMHIAECASPS